MRLFTLLFTLSFSMPLLAANPVVVVPGSNAGYLYFPAGSFSDDDGVAKVPVIVTKSGFYTDYRIVSDPPGLVIEADEISGQYDFEMGGITLILEGKYPVQGLTHVDVSGNWTEACVNNSSRSCTFTLTQAAGVTVEVADSPEPGTTMQIGANMDINVMYGGFILNKHYVIAHNYVGTAQAWHPDGEQSVSAARDQSDGAANTAAMVAVNSPAALHCTGLSGPDIGSGWYMPSRNEIALMLNLSDAAKSSLGLQKKVWSSTECKTDGSDCSKKVISFNYDNGSKNEVKDHDKKLDKINEASTLCFKPL